jgi:hypothetical protein
MATVLRSVLVKHHPHSDRVSVTWWRGDKKIRVWGPVHSGDGIDTQMRALIRRVMEKVDDHMRLPAKSSGGRIDYSGQTSDADIYTVTWEN